MAKKSPTHCAECDRKLSAKNKKIAKRIGADKVLCGKCTSKVKFLGAYHKVRSRFAETFRKLRDE